VAWSAPALAITGDLYAASQYNTDVVGNLNYLKGQTDGAAYLGLANTFTPAQVMNSHLTVGGVVFATGGRIAFPAIQVSDGGVNVLDDYEEGVWAPTLEFAGSNLGITYSTRSGTYTKIGNFVHAYLELRLANKGVAGGAADVAGFPFTPANAHSVHCGHQANLAAGAPTIKGFLSGTSWTMEFVDGAGGMTAINNTHFTNTSVIIADVTYRV
jgi:hypothetical protein